MDEQQTPYMPPRKVVSGFETAALTLGIISLVGCTCFYLSIPLGALAIIFASLSRGGNTKFSDVARIGLLLGIIGIAVSIGFTTFAVIKAYMTYGGWEGILKEYAQYTGYSYEELLRMLKY
ncbi:MAG: hypothetical protein E7282_04265 [Lachnospiraceae bacterium]|nr:hypothetical protein [Lachnospiraceae bacterium]